MAATYTVRINGIDRAETHVLLSGFTINEITNGINTLACEVESETASYRPLKRQEIEVEEDDGTSPVRLIFGGVIKSVRERGFGQPADGIDAIIQGVTADSFKTLAERRFVTASYPSQSMEATFTDIVNTYLAAYGVTVDPAQATGPTLEAMEFKVTRVDDVFNFLATLTAKYGAPFQWTIGYDKVAGMYQAGTVAAPWNLLESDLTTTYSQEGDVEVEPTDDEYANRIIVVWGSGNVVAVEDDTFTGDGVTTTFTLSKQLVGPGVPETNTAVGWGYVTRSTIFFETLGDLGTGAMWEYDPDANTITRTIGAPALGEIITIDYHGLNNGTVTAEDAGEIASFGIWEDKILAPEIESEALAQDVADAELQRRILTGKVVRFKTVRLPGPQPGQTITITVPKRNITGSYTVTDVTTESYPGDANTLLRTVTCNSNIHEQHHQTLTRWWSEKDHAGITQPTGSGAVPGPPPYSVQWNDSTTGKALFGGAYHILYYDLFWDQPDSGETQTKGLLFVTNQHMGAEGHIGVTDPQRLEMGMLGSGDFSMDMFGVDASILINATGNIELTAGTPVGSPNLFGVVGITGNQSILEQIASLSGIQPGVNTIPGDIGDSFSRFSRLNVIDGLCGFYQTISALPYTVNTTSASDQNEFLAFVNTAGTGTVFLPVRGTAGTPNYRMFPITACRRMLWFYNESGTMTLDANTVGGTTIGGSNSITLGAKSSVLIMGHDTEYKLFGTSGTVTGGGASSGATPGGSDKDVQFNDAGVFGGEDAFEYDKTLDRLTLIRSADNTQIKVRPAADDTAMIGLYSDSEYAEIQFGREIISGVDTARTFAPSYFYHQQTSIASPPGLDSIGMEINREEVAGSPMTFAKGCGFTVSAVGIAYIYQYGGLGSGSGSPGGNPGCGLEIDNNTDGNGAAAYVGLKNKDSILHYVWPDGIGGPRWSDAPPQEDGSPADSSGYMLFRGHAIVAAGDESIANDTLQNDDELFFSVGANEVWILEMTLFINSGTSNTPDFKWDFTLPASATIRYGAQGLSTAATAINGAQFIFGVETAATPGSAGTLTTGSIETMPVFINGTVFTAGTAGTVQFRWAQNTTTGGTPTVRRTGSWLKATRIT